MHFDFKEKIQHKKLINFTKKHYLVNLKKRLFTNLRKSFQEIKEKHNMSRKHLIFHSWKLFTKEQILVKRLMNESLDEISHLPSERQNP